MNDCLLVLAHEATRTGGPRVLLDLLRALRPSLPLPLSVRLLAGGPLADELRSLSEVDPLVARPRAVLVNGSAAAAAVETVDDSVPAIAYVHEEGEALDVLPERDRAALRTRFRRVVAVSERSRRDLASLGVPERRLVVIAPPVSERGTGDPAAGVPYLPPIEGRPLLLGCGEAGWRKGADLFVDVARRVTDRGAVHCVWAGRRPRRFARLLDHDTRTSGLDDCLHWLGELEEPSPLYRRADLLVVTSREDPQPLVPLEASFQSTATVGFSVGGLADLASLGAARVVPYPDTVALAEAIVELLADHAERHRLAARAQEVALDRSPDRVAARILPDVLDALRTGTP